MGLYEMECSCGFAAILEIKATGQNANSSKALLCPSCGQMETKGMLMRSAFGRQGVGL